MTPRSLALAAAICCAGPGSALAATYYVDQAAGSDTNAGTSPGAAWKNAPGMSAYTGRGVLAAGDVVYLNSASTWLLSGSQGLYLVGGVKYVGNGWGNGTRATLRAGADMASAVVRFRDHTTVPTEFTGFDVDANGMVANGIEMNHSFYAGPLTGANKRIDNVIVRRVWSRSSLGQFKYGIIVSNHGGSGGQVANVEILNSSIHDISRDGLPIYPGDESADSIVRNILVKGNTIYNTGQDPDYGAGAGIIVKGRVIDATIESNTVTATKGAGIFVNSNETNHFGYGPTNIHIRYNIVNVNTVHGSIRVYDGSSGGDPKDLSVYGNLVFNNSLNGGFLLGSDLRGANKLRVYNNTFYNAPVVLNSSSATFPVFEFRNNVVHQANGIPFTDNGKLTAHSNNLFSGGSTLVRSNGVNYGAANLGSFEASALSGDPQFANPAELPTGFRLLAGAGLVPDTTGLSLRTTSPGINRGAPLASPFDGSVNGVSRAAPGAADIGAYEYGSTAAPALTAPTNLRVQ
jgi:hypothetical protein